MLNTNQLFIGTEHALPCVFGLNAEIKTKDAERVQKPRLPKKRLLKKSKKEKSKSSNASNGAGEARSKGKGKKRSAKFCPKCGSTNVFWASGLPQLWSTWECRNCGYRGVLILEDSMLAEKLGKDYARKIIKQ